MTALRLALALLLLAPYPAIAQTKPKSKARYCLTEVEIKAEQEIRHGIFLRESSAKCDSWIPGIRDGWDNFAAANSQRFDAANQKRIKAFLREFAADWQNEMNRSDGRIVTYHRHFPLTQGYCDNVAKLVKELAKGYRAFTEQAGTVQNEVIADFKVCRK